MLHIPRLSKGYAAAMLTGEAEHDSNSDSIHASADTERIGQVGSWSIGFSCKTLETSRSELNSTPHLNAKPALNPKHLNP